MPNFNRVILAGNITRDIELKYLPKGTAVCNLGLAINRTWAGEDGQKKESVCFVDCKAFGRTAENLTQYFRRGTPILIEGRLDLEQWEDKKTKEKKQRLAVLVERFEFLKSKEADGDKTPTRKQKSKPAESAEPAEDVPGPDDGTDDVPF